MPGCPPDDALVTLAEGRLSDEEAAPIRDHVGACERCRVLLEALARHEQAAPEIAGAGEAGADALGGWSPPAQFDDFDVLGRLGRGGMGEVYVARERALDRVVALKFIAARNPDLRAFERFMVEARAIARLQHPNVVSIFRVGEVGGQPYIAYEFVSGQPLDRLPKPVAWQAALEIGLGLARGLAAAHRRGVLHRDIKPGNVMLGAGGEVKLLDFGLAKLMDRHRSPDAAASPPPRAVSSAPPPSREGETPLSPGAAEMQQGGRGSSPRLTEEHIVLGTPLYLAPELWAGGEATARSDLYALGLILYELCFGRLPHAGLDVDTLARIIPSLELPPLSALCPEVPRALADTIDRCVRRAPEDRFQSAEEVRAALEEVHALTRAFGLNSRPPSTPPASAAGRVGGSFARIGPRVDALAVRFYDRLFADVPALRDLFPADLRAQRARLATALRVVVEHLHAPDRLEPMLEELGRKHASYGVQEEHFDAFGRALIASIAELEGPAWTPEDEQAWAEVYAQIAAAMRRGLADAAVGAAGPVPPHQDRPSHPSTGGSGIHYVTSGDQTLAYQTIGDGPLDVVLVQGWVTHLESTWEHAAPAAFLQDLASFGRLTLLDQRGTGLSERDGAGAPPEQRMEDLRAVLDAAGARRAVLIGVGAGFAPCALFAAAHPERTAGLIAYGTAARIAAGSDVPFGMTPADLDQAEREIRAGWGRPLFLEQRAPTRARDAAFRRWWAATLRLGATPGSAIRMLKTTARVDLRNLLPQVKTPALVLHRAGDRVFAAAAGRDLAERIPGTRYVELPGEDHLPYVGNTLALLAEIRRFIDSVAATG